MTLEQDSKEKWYNWTDNCISKRTYGNHEKKKQWGQRKNLDALQKREFEISLSSSQITWNWTIYSSSFPRIFLRNTRNFFPGSTFKITAFQGFSKFSELVANLRKKKKEKINSDFSLWNKHISLTLRYPFSYFSLYWTL